MDTTMQARVAEGRFSLAMNVAYKSFISAKLDALKEKTLTDCSFLVGEDGGELEEFHGIKADFMILSGFMRGLFNSVLCPEFPVRIKNIKPKIFTLISEFVHVGRIVSQCSCIEATELAIAADHLLIDSLLPVCFELICSLVTVDQVWCVLDKLFQFGLNRLIPSCHMLLCNETKKCLLDKGFLTASRESVVLLITLDHIIVQNEKHLIDHCYKWAQNTSDAREAMRFLLPNFRLLALKPADATKLSHFLTKDEEIKLLRYFITKKLDGMPETFNLCVKNRMCPIIVPGREVMLISNDLCAAHPHVVKIEQGATTEVFITPKVDICIIHLKCLLGTRKERSFRFFYREVPLKYDYEIEVTETSPPDKNCYDVTLVTPLYLEKNVQHGIFVSLDKVDGFQTFPSSSYVQIGDPLHASNQHHFLGLGFYSASPIILKSLTYGVYWPG